jgi:hypothetical protein
MRVLLFLNSRKQDLKSSTAWSALFNNSNTFLLPLARRRIWLRREYSAWVSWELLEQLRENRNTGRSARMLFEVLGDMWVVNRNPYLQEDLINNKKRWKALTQALYSRLNQIRLRANGNKKVLELLNNADQAVDDFKSCLREFKNNKTRIKKALLKVTHNNNIRFDALSRSSHATDATDWRVEYPAVVITPDTELEIANIIKTCIKLGLTIIPRGGGTGYTGGAMIVNCGSPF